jgi:glycosyltransferase 2 family protein
LSESLIETRFHQWIDYLGHFFYPWIQKVKSSHRFLRGLSSFLTIAALFYIGGIIWFGAHYFQQLAWNDFLPAMLAALLIFLVAHLLQLTVWLRILSFHRTIDWQDVEIYCRMVLVRSLPGGIWHWVGRTVVYTTEMNIPARIAASANLVEWGTLIFVGIGIYFGSESLLVPQLRATGAIIAVAIAFGFALRWQPTGRPLRFRLIEAGTWILLYTITWYLGGWMISLIVQASGIHGLGVSEATRIWALAAVVSAIIVIIPVGFGLREITLTLMLQPYMPNTVGIVVALVMRFVMVIGDVVWGVSGWGISRLVQSKSKHPIDPMIQLSHEVTRTDEEI